MDLKDKKQKLLLGCYLGVSTISTVGDILFSKTNKLQLENKGIFQTIDDKKLYGKSPLRVSAIHALGRFKKKEARSPLIDGLTDANSDIRQACLCALKSSGWQPESDKERLYLTIAENRWSDCQAFGEIAIEPLISILNYEIETIQISVITALGQCGLNAQCAVEIILNKLFDPNTKNNELQKSCIEAIGLIPTKLAFIGLFKASLTFSEDLQTLALGKFNDIDETQKLAALSSVLEADFDFDNIIKLKNNPTANFLKCDPNIKLKIAAIKKLGELGSEYGINILISTMNQENEELVITCINTLSNHKKSNVISAIVKKLKDKKDSIKKVAIQSLGKLKAEIAVDDLIQLLSSLQKKSVFKIKISKIPTFSKTNLASDILYALQQIGTLKAQEAIEIWQKKE